MDLVECVPNFSEGRRADVIQAIRTAAEGAGVHVLDLHSDAVHHRSVLTIAGEAEAVKDAAFRSVAKAAELIDLRTHRGEHPRIGAADVVPFIPLGTTSMERCRQLARELGERIGRELDLPVFLYAQAAASPDRAWLPNIRRGEYEALQQEIQTHPERAPDFGPRRIGPAGACAVGARPFLLAYNVNLETSDLTIANHIARTVRQSSGGFPAVQARGMRTADPEVVQVSMNLLDLAITPAHVVFEAIVRLGAEHGARVLGAELVGLMPISVATAAAAERLGLPNLSATHLVEHRLLEATLTE